MKGKDGRPVMAFRDRAAWAQWLEANHDRSPGLWLKLAKKGSGVPSVSREEALGVALCYGWIDGQAAALDEQHWLQRYTPRTGRSKWSRRNREAALRLIEAGVMRPPGLAAVEAARADGRWDAAYAPQSEITVPPDLAAALDRHPAARARFEELDSRNRYSILYRIGDAKKPETRRRRIDTFVEMLRRGETIH